MERMEDKYLTGLIIATVAILVGLALWPAVSPNIGQMTKTFTNQNQTMTLPANGATSELAMCGQEAKTGTYFVVTNASDGVVVPSTNYTISSSTGTDGYLAAKITTTNSVLFASKNVNVSCTYEPKGYIDDSGSRGIVALIAVFLAILIAFAAIPQARDMLDVFRR